MLSIYSIHDSIIFNVGKFPCSDNGITNMPQHTQNPGYTFQILFFALFGLIEPDVLPPVNQ